KAVLTVYVTSTITFGLIRLMPGSPVEIKIDELMQQSQMSYADAAASASGLFDINLNAPIHEQYFEYLGNLVHGNLGNSFLSKGTSVMSIILSVLPWTLFAVGTGLLLSFVIGIGLGLIAARSPTAYVGRNAVVPLVSQFAVAAGAVVGGAVIIEQIFVYQAVGLRLVSSANQRDYPLVQGIILMAAVCLTIANLAGELL